MTVPSRNSLRCRSAPPRAGVTLVELIVVVVALGLIVAVVGIPSSTQLGAGGGDLGDHGDRYMAEITLVRSKALMTGEATTQVIRVKGKTLVITVFPDGRVIGAGRLGFDPLTGRPNERVGGEAVSDSGGSYLEGSAAASADVARHHDEPR